MHEGSETNSSFYYITSKARKVLAFSFMFQNPKIHVLTFKYDYEIIRLVQ